MNIISWNVNSIRARIDGVKHLIENHNPDCLVLQETKCRNEMFPSDFFEDLGYTAAINGEKSYNGVAILAKTSVEDIDLGLWSNSARYISALVGSKIRVICVYVPQGGTNFDYKLEWLNNLLKNINPEEPTCILGDFNIAPNSSDVQNSKLDGSIISTLPVERILFKSILDLGYKDILAQKGLHTWWDYRSKSQNNGLRLDHILLSEHLYSDSDGVLKEYRGYKRPSDHAPIWSNLCFFQ
jgi:exodeoxyribonuclease III